MLSVIANGAMGFTNSYGTFMVLLAVNGLAQSTGWSNTVGTMGQWFRREERGRVMGWWATCYQVGGVLANVLANGFQHQRKVVHHQFVVLDNNRRQRMLANQVVQHLFSRFTELWLYMHRARSLSAGMAVHGMTARTQKHSELKPVVPKQRRQAPQCKKNAHCPQRNAHRTRKRNGRSGSGQVAPPPQYQPYARISV